MNKPTSEVRRPIIANVYRNGVQQVVNQPDRPALVAEQPQEDHSHGTEKDTLHQRDQEGVDSDAQQR